MTEQTIILGIDPGTHITGYGVIAAKGNIQKPLDFGCIQTPKNLNLQEKHLFIYKGIEEILKRYPANAIAVETQFFYKNAQTAMKLGMVRGIVYLLAASFEVPLFEYAPKKAKLAVTGNGNAGKETVQKMIQLMLGLKERPEPEDAADALALAICHAHNLKGQYV